MWRVICDKCLHTETLATESLLDRDCPTCGCGELLGPFAVTPSRFNRETEWQLLTSSYYRTGGAVEDAFSS